MEREISRVVEVSFVSLIKFIEKSEKIYDAH